MKEIFNESSNEKVFVEFFGEKDVNGKTWYCITTLFRFTHVCHTAKYDSFDLARQVFEYFVAL